MEKERNRDKRESERKKNTAFLSHFSWLTILNCVIKSTYSNNWTENLNQDFSQFVRVSLAFIFNILLTLFWINTQQSILRRFILVIFTTNSFFLSLFLCECLCVRLYNIFAALKRLMLFLQVLSQCHFRISLYLSNSHFFISFCFFLFFFLPSAFAVVVRSSYGNNIHAMNTRCELNYGRGKKKWHM